MDIKKLQAGSVKLLGDGYISLVEAAEECGSTPADLAGRLLARQCGLFVRAQNWPGWHTADIHADFDHLHDPVTGEVVEVVIDGTRLGGIQALKPFSGYLGIRFTRELSGVLHGEASSVALCQFLFWPSASQGLVCDLPGQTITLADILVRRVDVTSITSHILGQLRLHSMPTSASVESGTAKSKETFSALCARYFDHNQHLWTKSDHRRRKADHTKIFEQLIGDLPVDELDRRVMRDFAEKIKDLPAERSKFARELSLVSPTFNDLVALKKAHGRTGISEGECRKILDTLAQIFNWAVAEGDMPANPASKLGSEAVRKASKRKAKAHEQRDLLSPDDLSKVFSASWFVNGVGDRTAKGTFYAYRPHYYWLPVLALYCGGRLNELAQLYVKDIVAPHGIHCLDFNLEGDGKIDVDEVDAGDADDKSLKNMSSARRVPIPQLVIDLGFIQYVERLRELGHKRLFSELNFDAEKGYGKYAGKWFNDALLGKKLGIPRDGKKTFHSMRHNFATALGTLHAAPNQKADLMGHTRKGSTSEVRYDKGRFESLKTLIDQVTHAHPRIHPFDVAFGVQALNDALKLKSSRRGKGASAPIG